MKSLTTLAILILLLSGSCTKTIYIPLESSTLRTDTVERIVHCISTDTIREKEYVTDTRYDSVAPILDSLNRVIGWDRYHFRESAKMSDRGRATLLARIDSLKQSHTDSVYIEKPVPVEKIVEVARNRSWWETTLLWAGALTLLAVIVAAFVRWMKRQRNNR